MNTNKRATEMEDVKINVKFKLSALWAAVMFLYPTFKSQASNPYRIIAIIIQR
jgi:hypothetical protein